MKTLPRELLRELFDYDDGRLIWKISPADNVKAGTVAGNTRKDGYGQVMYQYVNYLLHRLIYAWHTGEWHRLIDHIDGDPSNNRIENLQPLNWQQNIRRSRKSWGSVPYRGVYFDNRHKKFATAIMRNRVKYHLGFFDDPEEASKVYETERLKDHV